MTGIPKDLPGAELIAPGIAALRRGELTIAALLVSVGAHRLRAAGLEVPRAPALSGSPELALYAALAAESDRDVHSRYNALIRRLVRFERAMDRRRRARRSADVSQLPAGAPSRRPGCR